MHDLTRIFAVTGDAVVRFTLGQEKANHAESLLHGVEPRCVAVDPVNPNRIYVGTLDSGLYTSDDGGLTWRGDEEGLGDRRVLSLAVSASHRESGISVVYAGTEPSTSIAPRTAVTAGSDCRRCATCPASRSGRFRPARGPITCARSRFTRPIPAGSRSASSWAA